jgi:hypothetical protein
MRRGKTGNLHRFKRERKMEHFGFDEIPSPQPCRKSDPDWVLGRVDLLMSAYRKADYHNPAGFIATIGAILEQYDQAIVEYVTDPRTGIQRRLKWPPSPAEVVEACDAEIIHREKISRYSSMPPPLPRLTGSRLSVEQSYDVMVKKHGRPHGVFEVSRQLTYRG